MANVWQLPFNPKKCYIMHMTKSTKPMTKQYHLCGVPLASVSSSPYLGVQINDKLSWNTHVDYICGKASRMLGLLKRNLGACSPELKLLSYVTLVRPILEYSLSAWDPHTRRNAKKIEQLVDSLPVIMRGNLG